MEVCSRKCLMTRQFGLLIPFPYQESLGNPWSSVLSRLVHVARRLSNCDAVRTPLEKCRGQAAMQNCSLFRLYSHMR